MQQSQNHKGCYNQFVRNGWRWTKFAKEEKRIVAKEEFNHNMFLSDSPISSLVFFVFFSFFYCSLIASQQLSLLFILVRWLHTTIRVKTAIEEWRENGPVNTDERRTLCSMFTTVHITTNKQNAISFLPFSLSHFFLSHSILVLRSFFPRFSWIPRSLSLLFSLSLTRSFCGYSSCICMQCPSSSVAARSPV